MANLKINILTFNHAEPVTIAFFKEQRSKSDISLKRSEIPFEVYEQLQPSEQESITNIYTDFISQDNPDYQIEIDLTKSTRFARHYYNFLIRQYFKTKATFVTDNFVADTEVWFRDESLCTARFNTYRVYTLKVQIAKLSELPELVICDNGTSRISTSSLLEIDNLDDDIIKTVVYDDMLFKYEDNPELRSSLDKVYPLINNPLATFLELPVSKRPTGNKYIRTFNSINGFISNHLDNEDFKKVIALNGTDLMSVPEEKIFRTKKKSSYINLGVGKEKVSVLTPKGNLKEHGPFAIPNKPVKFIAIFHEEDKAYANKLHVIFNRLYKSKSGKHVNDQYGTSLYDFIRVKFDLDIEKSIILKSLDSPHTAINNFLDKNTIDTDKYNYVAIYLSPIKKDDEDVAKQRIYYDIKKTLLFNFITSQVIYKESLNSTYFKKLYYQNIAAAILGKSGGIPWKLASEPNNELVIGLGAFRSKKFETQYIGSAFCFSNNGEFQEFNCMAKRNSDLLAQEIKLYLETYIDKHGTPERIVIHYYKKMSREELEPINEMVYNLGFGDIPIIIVTINKTMSKDYIVFDEDAPEDLIPVSGTIVNYARDQYLLFNNTRYPESDAKIESYHLPLKLSISSNNPAAIRDVAIKKELLEQIYQFSRMYWKSVKQQNLPVTIKYPEMVAEIFPYFGIEELMPFGRTNLWFL